MKKELAVVENKELSLEQQWLEQPWGAAEDITAQDFIMPKLLLTQKMSKATDAGAKMGDWVDSITQEVLGSNTNPIQVVAFQTFPTWQIFEVEGNKKKYKETIPVTPENANMPREEEGRKNVYCINFYVLLVNRGEANEQFPYMWTLSGTASRVGKAICTTFKKLQMKNKPSASVVLQLSAQEKENDEGKWVVPAWSVIREATIEEIIAARRWYEDIKLSRINVKVDEEVEV